MAFKLDPREVLAHLNRLGYYNITTEQLRDFIRDLKKLIKFDKQCCCHHGSKTSGESYIETASEPLPSHQTSTSSVPLHAKSIGRTCVCDQERLDDNKENRKNPSLLKNSRPKSASAARAWQEKPDICTGSASFSSSSSTTEDLYGPPLIRICHAEKELKQGGKLISKSVENVHEATKPRSSFIKPWRLQAATALPHRSDPVALYHKYQSIWQQQKVPGENRHEGLRWSVREKMLGQDPHPRPISRTSSIDAVSRRQKKM